MEARDIQWLTVVGARPQFIKSVALTRAVAKSGGSQVLIHAGQHKDDAMGSDFLTELEVSPPDHRLSPSQKSRSHRLADMMSGIAEHLEAERPNFVLVYGDTDSTLAGALAAHHAGIPLVHVEAGLRSGDLAMPEEHIRIMVDQLSDFCVTTGPGATTQLLKEGKRPEQVLEAGDVMLDVALAAREVAQDRQPPQWPSARGPVLMVTLHRPALVDNPLLLKGALQALDSWSLRTGGTVYFPMHPRTQKRIQAEGLSVPSGLVMPGPMGYLDVQSALIKADMVLTDSGGLQKEAWYQGTPSVVLRSTTEWRELLQSGASQLFDPGTLSMPSSADELAHLLAEPWSVPSVEESDLFGGGQAANRMLDGLFNWMAL